MTLQSSSHQSFSPDDITVIFRDNKAEGVNKILRYTVSELVRNGYPLDKDGKPVKSLSAKIQDSDSNIFVGNLDTVGVHYEDGTSQSLGGFLAEMDGTTVIEVTYYDSERTLDITEQIDEEFYYE